MAPSNGEVVLDDVAAGEGQLASERSGNRSISLSLSHTSDIEEEDMESCPKPPSIEVVGPGDDAVDGGRPSQSSNGLSVSSLSHTTVPSLEEVESGVIRERDLCTTD